MREINHLGNGIMVFDGFIEASRADVQRLISDIELNVAPEGYETDEHGRVLNSGGYEHKKEEHRDIAPLRYVNTMFNGISKENVATISSLEEAIYNSVVAYCKQFPTAMTSIRWKTRGYLIRYNEGHSMGPHSDASIPYRSDQTTPLNQQPLCNTLTCTITLNDEFTGGETGFRPWGISVPGVYGRILVYPANFIGCHEIYPVTDGTRYAYLSWYAHGDILGASPKIPLTKDETTTSWLNSSSYIDFDEFSQEVGVQYQPLVPLGNISEGH